MQVQDSLKFLNAHERCITKANKKYFNASEPIKFQISKKWNGKAEGS